MVINKPKKVEIHNQIKQWSSEGESKSITASFKVSASQLIALDAIAEKKGTTRAELQRFAVEFLMSYINHAEILMAERELIIPILDRLTHSD